MISTRRITTTAAVIVSLAAAGAPTATARPIDDQAIGATPAPASVYSRPDKSMIPVTASPEQSTSTEASAQQAVVRIQMPPSGFDWGDAGIGAAGGVALSMLGLGGALAVSQNRARRTRRSSSTTALPS